MATQSRGPGRGLVSEDIDPSFGGVHWGGGRKGGWKIGGGSFRIGCHALLTLGHLDEQV